MSETRRCERNPFFGRNHSKKTRRALARLAKAQFELLGHPRKGTKHSKKSLRKMSESHKGVVSTQRIRVMCNETGIVFASVTQAAKECGIDTSSLSKHLRRIKYSRIGGLTFSYC